MVSIESALLDADQHFNQLEDGVLTCSWNNPSTSVENTSKDAVQFTLVFRAKAGHMVSQLLSVGSEYTSAEAYNSNGDLMEFN
ncbi:MAG: hypothetical protein R2769_02645 [Saprospiraceae bacterium]